MKDNLQKKFIAGAICPKCHLMDKTVIYTIDDKMYSECVRCGHQQSAIKSESKTNKKTGKSRTVIWLAEE